MFTLMLIPWTIRLTIAVMKATKPGAAWPFYDPHAMGE